ncbi:VWA domain-containing protein [Chamaesiphon sp.]|uniref:vWA domain-containing protein n=1 Tax=Chamaesiphon sp. TaxID=2814140 RepID=UPI0035939A30
MFNAEVFQNPYLPQGASEVNAIMTIGTSGEGVTVAQPHHSLRLFGIICDISGSMGGAKIIAAKDAIVKIIELLPPDTLFFVVTGSSRAKLLVPLVNAIPENKLRAISQVKEISANGGTLMSTWLHTAVGEFNKMPQAICQALLLTDGQNDANDELDLVRVLDAAEGKFQCDCRGVGTDWRVSELQKIAARLLGTTDIIASPDRIADDFQAILTKAMGKTVSDVSLRLWTPVGAKVLFCKQVSPEIVDVTSRAKVVSDRIIEYPTGAWGSNESRDYHFCIQITAGNVGDEMLAGRASLIAKTDGVETKITEAKILATWTEDEAKTAKIDRRVAHYTGQAELAQSIQEGLEARAQGNIEVATVKLGKAVKLAHDSGNEATAKLLRSVVDVEDAAAGTVRIKRTVAKEDEMMLETRSTKTARIQK